VASHDADLTNLVPDVQKATTDILNAHPDLNAIWGCCDFTVAGAVPAIRAAGKKIKVYSLHGVPSTVPLVKSGFAVAEMADSFAASFIAVDQLARHWTTGAKFSKTVPKNEAFKMTIVDQSNASKGYPFPMSKILASFKRRWAKLYIKAG